MLIRTQTKCVLLLLQCRKYHNRCRIGTREVVGHGINGIYGYKDDAHFPFPSVRFMEDTKVISAVRQREKCNWHYLSLEDKKLLYRASFCQTFAEFQHPTGQWKIILGGVLFLTSFVFWIVMFQHYFVQTPLPISLSLDSQMAQLRRMIEIRVNPITGISSLWDYDQNMWKAQSEAIKRKEKADLVKLGKKPKPDED